jgi:hypothetical protein
MKNILLSILFLVTLQVNAQWWKFAEVTLITKNKDTLNGYGRIDTYKFIYKSTDGKITKYKYEEIDKVIFDVYLDKNKTVNDKIILYKLNIEKISPTFLQPCYAMGELIYESDILKIYGVRTAGGTPLGPPKSKKENFKVTRTGGYVAYYCQVKSEEKLRVIYEASSLFKTFRTSASLCFEDCINLSKKIETKELTESNLIDIGDFYSIKCN